MKVIELKKRKRKERRKKEKKNREIEVVFIGRRWGYHKEGVIDREKVVLMNQSSEAE